MTSDPHVLIVDDSSKLLAGLARALRKEPYRISTATSADDALHILSEIETDIVITDHFMPHTTGISLLETVMKEYPQTVRVLMTGHPSVPLTLRAINDTEVFRFIAKPFSAVDLALVIREGLLLRRETQAANRMVDTIKMQSSYIRHLEREHPGITAVERNSSGQIVLSTETDSDFVLRVLERKGLENKD